MFLLLNTGEQFGKMVVDIYDRFMNTGRLTSRKSYLRKKILASAALGNNEMYILMMNGRLSIDLLR